MSVSLYSIGFDTQFFSEVVISDEPDVIYHTFKGMKHTTSERFYFCKDFFCYRYFETFGAKLEKLDTGKYLYTDADGKAVTITFQNKRESTLFMSSRLKPNRLVAIDAWNKEYCYYDEENDTVAIGIDMFAFDYSNVPDKNFQKFRKRLLLNHRKRDPLLDSMIGTSTLVPAFIIEKDKTIYIDVIAAETGTRLTYHRIKPTITDSKKEIIHIFVTKMMLAYKVLQQSVKAV